MEEEGSFIVDIELNEIRPIVIAWTTQEVMHPHIFEHISAAGFDMALESPILMQHFSNLVVPYMENREKSIKQRVDEYEIYHRCIAIQNISGDGSSNPFQIISQNSLLSGNASLSGLSALNQRGINLYSGKNNKMQEPY